MISKTLASSALAAAVLASLAAGAPAAGQQHYEPPRTTDGRPDLQGVWSNATVTGLTRPPGYPLVLTRAQADELEAGALYNRRVEEEAGPTPVSEGAPEAGAPLPPVGNYSVVWTDPGSKIAEIGGELRSSWIVYPEDGQIPALTEEGEALRAASARMPGARDGHPEERSLGERCILGIAGSGGPPLGSSLYNNNVRIVQTEDHLMILAEMNHDARIVRIGGTHRDDGVEPWLGDSVGRWEGDTLVVETVSIHPAQRGGRILLSEDAKVIERFTRVRDDQILYQFEIDDPTVYTDGWRAEVPLNAIDGEVYEYACHEGNYGLANILSGGRRADRLAAAEGGAGEE